LPLFSSGTPREKELIICRKCRISFTIIFFEMHPEILSKEQLELLPFLGQFNKRFFLVGGTAIALQIGHRQSIDFDLFCAEP